MRAHRRQSYLFSLGWRRFALRVLAALPFARPSGRTFIWRQTRAWLAAAVVTVLVFELAGSATEAFGGSFDGGGRVGDYLSFVAKANASGERVAIAGICASACTIKLGARGACVYGDAQLWFHAARNGDGRVNALATLIMLRQYPRGVRAWAQARGALASVALTPMSGAEAIALGVPDCERAYSPRATQETAVSACFGAPDRRAVARLSTRICARRSPAAFAAATTSVSP